MVLRRQDAARSGTSRTQSATDRQQVGSTIRVPAATREVIDQIMAETGFGPQQVVEMIVETYRRQRILDLTNRAYAAMKLDERAWEEELAERAEWDGVLGDGIDPIDAARKSGPIDIRELEEY